MTMAEIKSPYFRIALTLIVGVAAGAGAAIPGEVYAWVVVFLLPINSAINPLLYTISSIRLKAVST